MSQRCFRAPIPEVLRAAQILRSAADAHLRGDADMAGRLLREANDPVVREWIESIWGKASPYVNFRPVENGPPLLKKVERLEVRMPSSAEKTALLLRDGFHCRFCDLPVIRREVRQHLHAAYPVELPWGRTNANQHAAFQALWAQYDHVLPHARGGTNEPNNMLITCAGCNFGRMDFTLEEVGIVDPRSRPIHRSDWNGLEDVLPINKRVVGRI